MGRLFGRRVPARSSTRPTFEALFQTHFLDVLAAVQKFGVPARFAEDVAQDVFVAVFKALDRYDPSRPLQPWLKAITYRTAREHLNHGRRREHLTPTAQLERMEASVDPEQHLSRKQAQEIFREVIQHLEADHRTIFLMAEIDQLTHLQISIALGISKSMVQWRLRRARADFDRALQRKRAAEEHRFGLVQVPFALVGSAELIRANRTIVEVPSEVQARVWHKVLGRVRPSSSNVKRGSQGAGQMFALSLLACLLLDNRTHPDIHAAAPLAITPAAVLEVIESAPAEVTPAAAPAAALTAAPTAALTAAPAAAPVAAPVATPAAAAPSAVVTQKPVPGAAPEDAFHSGMKILNLARTALAMSQPIEASRLLKRHMREHPNSQIAIREMLLAETMEQLAYLAATGSPREKRPRR